jgi:hypothetical protein
LDYASALISKKDAIAVIFIACLLYILTTLLSGNIEWYR